MSKPQDELSQLQDAYNGELAKRDAELARQKELYQRLLIDSRSLNNASSSKEPLLPDSPDDLSFRNKVFKAIEDVTALQNQWQASKNMMKSISIRLDHQEAYSRLNSLLLHGLKDLPIFSKDEKGKSLKFCRWVKEAINTLFEEKLDFTLHTDDIDTAHVLRTRKGNSNVVIVKFVRRSIRNLYWYGKNALKNTGISLTEHLTAKNLELLRAAKDAVGDKCVWTNQCVVYVQANQIKKRISCKQDLIQHTGVTEVNVTDPFSDLCTRDHQYPSTAIADPQIFPDKTPDSQQFIPATYQSVVVQPNPNNHNQLQQTDINNYQYTNHSFSARGYSSHRGRGRGNNQNNAPRGYYRKRRY